MGATIPDEPGQIRSGFTVRRTIRAIVLTDPQQCSLMLVRGGRYVLVLSLLPRGI